MFKVRHPAENTTRVQASSPTVAHSLTVLWGDLPPRRQKIEHFLRFGEDRSMHTARVGAVSLLRTSSRLLRSRLLLFVAILFASITSSSLRGQSGVLPTGVPTGTTNVTNHEIQVVAPDKVSYRYSINDP